MSETASQTKAEHRRAILQANPATTVPAEPFRQRFLNFITHRRVPISIVLFGALVVEDIVVGTVPHDICDLTDAKAVFGLLAVLGGLAVRSWAAGFLVKNTELTTAGPYALLRNPLYFGSFLMIAGFCLLIDDRENIWIMPCILLALYLPLVLSEERRLSDRFPEAWRQYAALTPRFVPRLTVWPRMTGWRLSQWMRSREYKAVLATALALVVLKIGHHLYR